MLIRFVYIATFVVWVISFFTIASLGGGFETQAPLCIFSTIAIFSISTFIVKKIEKNQKRAD